MKLMEIGKQQTTHDVGRPDKEVIDVTPVRIDSMSSH